MAVFSRPKKDDDRAEGARRALEAALQVSEVTSSTRPLPEAMRSALSTTMNTLGADQSCLMLLDETGDELVLAAAAGVPKGVPLGHRIPAGDGFAGRVPATGRPWGPDETGGDRSIVAPHEPISSSLVVPLLAEGKPIGILNVGFADGQHTFTAADRRLAQLFAEQVADLIHRTRLQDEAERRSSDLTALMEAGKGLFTADGLDPTLQAVLDGATRLVGKQHGFVCLLDPQSGAVARGVFRGIDKSRIGAILSIPEVVAAVDTEDPALIDVEGVHYLAAGFQTPEGTRGLIVLTCEQSVPQAHRYLMKAFAQQSGAAIGAAELYSMLQRKESEFGSIIQSVANPIIVADAHRRLVTLNPSAEALFGISSSFCEGTDVAGSLGHPEVERILLGSGPVVGEVEVGVPAHYFKVRATDVRVPGAPVGRLLVMDDVTNEREMRQTQHDFVAMIGHELRTPLTIVKGYTKMLLKKLEGITKEDAADALTTIDARANQLERLLEDLLYVSKIESHAAKLRMDTTNLHQVVHLVMSEILAEYPDADVKVEIPQELTWACDETKVGLVLRHLIENAVKYSETPADVLIRTTEKDEELHVDVIDRGAGIVSSDIPHIFERFRQLDASSTRVHGGMGVGLYLCAQLVKVHGGRIWVDSTWGKGSTFSFSLPRQTPAYNVTVLGETAASRTA
ncbi:MAG: ATP-binding protein [Actinomycetota bacterium]